MFRTRLGNVKTKTMARLIERDMRIEDISDETDNDGFFIYTNSREWDDGNGSGTFRGDTETDAVKRYRQRVTRNDCGRE